MAHLVVISSISLVFYKLKKLTHYAGGVILNLTKDVNLSKLERTIKSRMKRGKIDEFDVIITKDSKVIKIIRHKK